MKRHTHPFISLPAFCHRGALPTSPSARRPRQACANQALRTVRTYLGRVTRDVVRKIKGGAELESVFAHPLILDRGRRGVGQHSAARAGRRASGRARGPAPLFRSARARRGQIRPPLSLSFEQL